MAKSTKKSTSAKAKKAANPAKKKITPKKSVTKKAVSKKPAAKKVVAKKAVAKKATKPSKPVKKVVKPVAKKVVKPAPKAKVVSSKVAAKPSAKPAAKSVLKPVVKKVPAKPARVVKEDKRTRFSDIELKEFKELITEKLDAAKAEVRYLNDQINRKDDNGTDDTENKFATMDDGSATMEREYLTQMSARQAQYIDHLEKALIRIENKTYGVCRVTGKLIEKDRLRAVPHATLSMEAKMMQAAKN